MVLGDTASHSEESRMAGLQPWQWIYKVNNHVLDGTQEQKNLGVRLNLKAQSLTTYFL